MNDDITHLNEQQRVMTSIASDRFKENVEPPHVENTYTRQIHHMKERENIQNENYNKIKTTHDDMYQNMYKQMNEAIILLDKQQRFMTNRNTNTDKSKLDKNNNTNRNKNIRTYQQIQTIREEIKNKQHRTEMKLYAKFLQCTAVRTQQDKQEPYRIHDKQTKFSPLYDFRKSNSRRGYSFTHQNASIYYGKIWDSTKGYPGEGPSLRSMDCRDCRTGGAFVGALLGTECVNVHRSNSIINNNHTSGLRDGGSGNCNCN